MFIGPLTIEHVCHSERSEESLIFFGPVGHKNKPRCFASLNMILAMYRCPGRAKVEYSARENSATIFLFRIGLPCGNRADYGGGHENPNENLYSSWRTRTDARVRHSSRYARAGK